MAVLAQHAPVWRWFRTSTLLEEEEKGIGPLVRHTLKTVQRSGNTHLFVVLYSNYNQMINLFMNLRSWEKARMAESISLGMRSTIRMVKAAFPNVQNVNTDTLQKWMAQQNDDTISDGTCHKRFLILDCRPEEEFAVSCIQGSLRLDPHEEDMEKVLGVILQNSSGTDERMAVVFYCSVGYRSSRMAARLQKALRKKKDSGMQLDLFNLEGSLFQWANEERPLVKPSGEETRFVHPYNLMWGCLLDAERRKYSPD